MTATAQNVLSDTGATARSSHPGKPRETLTGWGFIAPFGILFILFMLVPIFWGIYLSFTNQSLTGAGGDFIGVANYAEALGDPDMWRSMLNTVWFTILSTVPLVVIALALALLVNTGLPGQWLWRLSFFMPYLLASTVVSLIWVWLYNPQLGLFNAILGWFGVDPVTWLQDPDLAMLSVVVTTVWWTIGFNFLLYLAALQNIPDTQYEAASLDGAGPWRTLFSITIPQLGPTTAMVIVLQLLASLKVFDQIYQMTGGGPAGTTRSAIQYIFESGFTGFRFGYSSAISYIFFILIIIVSVIQFRITARRSA
ncbi:carbohydrate ABC transporter permease [Microbacterium sp. MPKO10]|uniref:carbohydrate ABC transporter permease n=1 Tax=Microbacterium sp. MPKO10 TaxID=2989818 RepID=UPI0022355FF3|nr:sugar ABC transporter permease [Microbacterium sp. MPKO10]MCW4456765.1 sugar ABC transporter permease [Microbacterium sp. MPKO10]